MTPIEARRKYHREWRKKNPDKVKGYEERFWAKKAAEADGLAIERRAMYEKEPG